MDPGEYTFCSGRLLSGWSGSATMFSHSGRLTRLVKKLGSYAGAERSARISPVFGSSAIAEPTLSAKYSSAIFWSERSIVRRSVFPGSGDSFPDSATSRPNESMT